MLIQIGSPTGPSDIVDLLLECHERIRSFTGLACTLASAHGVSESEVRDVAARVTRYFSEALPLHTADEEQSILPRLAGRDPELDAALKRMQSEHHEHEPQLQRLLEICRALQASPERIDQLRASLLSTASALDKAFSSHLEQEEQVVLPAIRALLMPEERDAILSELRARRNSIAGGSR